MELFRTGLEAVFAAEQTSIFEDMRTQALTTDNVDQAIGSLEYAVGYYPSGTKQRVGTSLDRVVERRRRSAVREMIAHLRHITDQNFGDDTTVWIDGLRKR